jgi:hypothetical protein
MEGSASRRVRVLKRRKKSLARRAFGWSHHDRMRLVKAMLFYVFALFLSAAIAWWLVHAREARAVVHWP